jgi:TQO small subunit DoxA
LTKSRALGARCRITARWPSLDNVLLKRNPRLVDRAWFRWLAGSLPFPLTDTAFRNLGLAVLAAVLAFDIGTYSYYRGSVVTPYHRGPVSPTQHHFALSNAALLSDGGVKFHIYLDGGTPAAPAHIMKAELTGGDNQPLETWNTETLTRLPADSIHNDFAYNQFKAGPYGLIAQMGAMATITLPRQPKFQSARGWEHHSEADRRERAQLQPEAGRHERELLSSGPSGGGRADLLDHLAQHVLRPPMPGEYRLWSHGRLSSSG